MRDLCIRLFVCERLQCVLYTLSLPPVFPFMHDCVVCSLLMHINAPMMDSLSIVNPMQKNNYADLMLSPFREICKLSRRVESGLLA